MKHIWIVLLVSITIFSCEERSISMPKQRGYFRIDLNQKYTDISVLHIRIRLKFQHMPIFK